MLHEADSDNLSNLGLAQLDAARRGQDVEEHDFKDLFLCRQDPRSKGELGYKGHCSKTLLPISPEPKRHAALELIHSEKQRYIFSELSCCPLELEHIHSENSDLVLLNSAVVHLNAATFNKSKEDKNHKYIIKAVMA